MTSRVIRDLQHQAVEDPEFASHYQRTIERLTRAEQRPHDPTPMIQRHINDMVQWHVDRARPATCRFCRRTWHAEPNDLGCPSSLANLRD